MNINKMILRKKESEIDNVDHAYNGDEHKDLIDDIFKFY